MKKKYTYIDDYKRMDTNFTFDDMIKVLLEADNKGDMVYAKYDGKVFNSVNFNEEEAYLIQFNMTKREKEYYDTNMDRIKLSLIGNTSLCSTISDELFKEYTQLVIQADRDTLQVLNLISRSIDDIKNNEEDSDNISRFLLLNNKKKLWASEFIETYIDDYYKDTLINLLGLQCYRTQTIVINTK
jgi:hypothetical protein